MKSILLSAALAAGVNSVAIAAAPESPEAEIRTLYKRLAASFTAKDHVTYMKCLAPDYTYVNKKDARTVKREQVEKALALLKRSPRPIGGFDIRIQKIKVEGAIAQARITTTLTTREPGIDRAPHEGKLQEVADHTLKHSASGWLLSRAEVVEKHMWLDGKEVIPLPAPTPSKVQNKRK